MATPEPAHREPGRPSAPRSAPAPFLTLIERYDATAFTPARRARVRLQVADGHAWDAELEGGSARLVAAAGEADAVLGADERTWRAVADDIRGGMAAYGSGRLSVRRNLHLGVGFLAATSGLTGP